MIFKIFNQKKIFEWQGLFVKFKKINIFIVSIIIKRLKSVYFSDLRSRWPLLKKRKKWLREIILTPEKDPLFIYFVKKLEFYKDFKGYFIGKDFFQKNSQRKSKWNLHLVLAWTSAFKMWVGILNAKSYKKRRK